MRVRINSRKRRLWLAINFVAGVFLALFSGSQSIAAQAQTSAATTDAVSRIGISSLTDELGGISGQLQKDASPESVTALSRSLPLQWTVTTPEKDYSISTEYLRSQLAAGSRENAKAWVDHLATELSSYSVRHPAGPANARTELDRILAGPEFATVHPPTAWDLFRQRFAAWLERLFARLFGGLARYPIGGRLLFWVIVVACLGFIAMWLFRLTTSRDQMDTLPPGHIVAASRTWQEWIRAAREAASRQDFREAVHCAYWAGIARLEDAGAVPKDPTKTPREYFRLVCEPSAHELAPRLTYREPLSALTARLEQIWYANRGANSDDFRDALRQLEALGCQLE